jgi:cysteinyl-tRNA synthetase
VTLTLYNTLTRRKEPFRPLDPKNVRLYVCGPTVYDYAHIGNARPVIVFDVLFRLLRHIYGREHVTYARNITDVDDKINARAAEEGVSIRALTERTTKQFHEDVAALGVLPPTVEPRATEHIAEMKGLIETLVANGCAYVGQDHVLFEVAKMPDYGRLSNRSLAEMEAGARVEVAPYKRDPMDFVLWKPSKAGEPAWDSPCGIAAPGRPGWHIECSAMAERHLGEVFDIHGGGIDLVFPHHENEIAQSRCAHGTERMAQVWMHNGFLQVEGEKMAKSLGNFVTVRELLDTTKFGGRSWLGEVLRLAMLMTHYRQPIDWTRDALASAQTIWRDLVIATRDVHPSEVDGAVVEALSDDLNTPAAINTLQHLKDASQAGDRDAARLLSASLVFLGLIRPDLAIDALTGYISVTAEPDDLFRQIISKANGDTFYRRLVLDLQRRSVAEKIEPEFFRYSANISSSAQIADLRDLALPLSEIDGRVIARLAARKARNFTEADRIRDELAVMGIQLKDGKDPETGEPVTTWEVKR